MATASSRLRNRQTKATSGKIKQPSIAPDRRGLLDVAVLGLFLVVAGLMFGCAAAVPRPEPTDYYHAVLRARFFLDLAAYLTCAPQDPRWLGQGVRCLYYCYFCVARVVRMGKGGSVSEQGHATTWRVTELNPREFLGGDVQKQRNFHDYGVRSGTICDPADDTNEARRHLEILQGEGGKAFGELLADAEEQLAKRLKHCTSNPRSCPLCRGPEQCLKERILSELGELKRRHQGFLASMPNSTPAPSAPSDATTS
jgi:hypothetical protein